MSPKLIGYFCQRGAYAFFEKGHALLRALPRGVHALPVVHVTQLGIAEITKAFRLGAAGVLMVGCETCGAASTRAVLEQKREEYLRDLAQWGISSKRLVLAWCSPEEPEKFFEIVNTTMANLEPLPPLVLPRLIDTTIQHCG